MHCGRRSGAAHPLAFQWQHVWHPMAPALTALLWDVDGTLAETEFEGHRLAFNHSLADAGLPWRWDRPT